jgi:hypothetical protein
MRAPAAQRLAVQEKTSGQFVADGPCGWAARSSSGEHDTLSNVDVFRTDTHENRPFVAQTVSGQTSSNKTERTMKECRQSTRCLRAVSLAKSKDIS